MDDSPASTTTNPPPAGRQDTVTWVLTAVTATVLVVGVLVVRSTRSDQPRAADDTVATGTQLIEEPPKEPPRENFIVGLPEPEAPSTPPPASPSTAELPGNDRR